MLQGLKLGFKPAQRRPLPPLGAPKFTSLPSMVLVEFRSEVLNLAHLIRCVFMDLRDQETTRFPTPGVATWCEGHGDP